MPFGVSARAIELEVHFLAELVDAAIGEDFPRSSGSASARSKRTSKSHGRTPSFQSLPTYAMSPSFSAITTKCSSLRFVQSSSQSDSPSAFSLLRRRSVFDAMAMPFASVVPLQKTLFALSRMETARALDRLGVIEARHEDERVPRTVLHADAEVRRLHERGDGTGIVDLRFRGRIARLDGHPRQTEVVLADRRLQIETDRGDLVAGSGEFSRRSFAFRGDVEAGLAQLQHRRHQVVETERRQPLRHAAEVARMERQDRPAGRFPDSVAGAETDERRAMPVLDGRGPVVAELLAVAALQGSVDLHRVLASAAESCSPTRRGHSPTTDSRTRPSRPFGFTATGFAGSVTSLTETAFCTSANISPAPERKLIAFRCSGSHSAVQSMPLTNSVCSSSIVKVCCVPERGVATAPACRR